MRLSLCGFEICLSGHKCKVYDNSSANIIMCLVALVPILAFPGSRLLVSGLILGIDLLGI